MNTKIIAIYLPQYHEVEENNIWWGKGHTEWSHVRKAIPLFRGHYQPRIPLNKDYYDLSDHSVLQKQARLAHEHGIHGFCFYHYWFTGKKLLHKPLEAMLRAGTPDFPFCLSWANHNWINKVQRKGRQILIKQEYGNEDNWKEHFQYLLQYFSDKRYIRVDGRPLFVIHDPVIIPCFEQMRAVWDKMAREAGLDGLYYVNTLKFRGDAEFSVKANFDAQMEYFPSYALHVPYGSFFSKKVLLKFWILACRDVLRKRMVVSYDYVWKEALRSTPDNGIRTFLGAFLDWDTTPRWGNKGGVVYHGATPEKFRKYLEIQLRRSAEKDEKGFLFITAWNEWSEGAYLEPDERFGHEYLSAVREALRSKEN